MKLIKNQRFFLIAIFCLLCGCATPIQSQYDALSQRKADVTNFDQIKYSDFFDNELSFKIDKDSPVIEVGGIKSYFKAIKLQGVKGLPLFVKSYFNGMMIGQYFDPVFIELDSKFKPIKVTSINLDFHEGDMFGDQMAGMNGVYKPEKNSAYLVIIASDSFLKVDNGEITTGISNEIVTTTPSRVLSGSTWINLTMSPTGELKIKVR